jgi:GNAT superfamily N-acetyltransferase
MTNDFLLKKAQDVDKVRIWEILEQAIQLRKDDGSSQWQDGYPNPQVVENDIQNGYGYVLIADGFIIAYVAIIFDIEPAYEVLEGRWLSDQDYAVVHRLAVAQDVKVKGAATSVMSKVEDIARAQHIFSIRVDTNYDNAGMLRILEKLGYEYCGEVYFRGGARRAFEKLL